MADVFISYSKRARDLTLALERALAAENLSVWWDKELTSGESFRHEIRRQLVAATAVVVIWSRPALESDWVYAEAAIAARSGRLVSVIADDVTPNELPLPFGEVFHLVRHDDVPEIVRGVRSRIEGQLEPARDKKFDARWAGFWLLDPQQMPFDASDANPSPASLLLARHALVPFLEIDGELSDFIEWAKGSGSTTEQGRKAVCARVVDGAGGLGKTRLMIEVCARLSDEGWLAGFVAENLIGKGYETSEGRLRALIEEGNGARPLLLVVDYAETRRADVEWICKRLLRRRNTRGSPARLVLVSRAAGEWWTELFGDPEIQKLFGRDNGEADIISLERLSDALTSEKRQQLFSNSVESIGYILREAGRANPPGPPSQDQINRVASSADNARPLAIQLEALLHLYGEAPSNDRVGIDVLLDRVLRLETSSWPRRLKFQEDRNRRLRVARAVCQTTLVKNVDSKERAVSLFKLAESCSDDVADAMHYEVHMLYGRQRGGLWPLEPDLIGEHHVASTSNDKIVDSCLAWAGDSSAQRRDILTVLNRASRDEHGTVAAKATAQLLRLIGTGNFREDLDAIAAGTPGRLLELLNEVRHKESLPAQEIAQQSTRSDRQAPIDPSEGRGPRGRPAPSGNNRPAPSDDRPSSPVQHGEDVAFFISRAGSDERVASKIASILEQAGHKVVLQDWNFSQTDFMNTVSAALERGARVLALLSPAYLASDYTTAEWMTVLRDDPRNLKARLVPIRIAPCEPRGLLSAIAFTDLVPVLSSDEELARSLERALGIAGESPASSDATRALLHKSIRAQPDFVARNDQLMAIDSALWSGSTSVASLVGVSGIGGIGKSSLAREYAWQARDGYAGIWWIAAEDEARIIDGLIELGSQYMPHLRQMDDRERAARHVLDYLAHGGFSKPWLLIYDDLADSLLLEKWAPPAPIRTLVTTRLAGLEQATTEIRVDTWTIEQSVEFLSQEVPQSNTRRSELQALAAALACMPLALSQAAAFLRSHPEVPVQRYLGMILHTLQKEPGGRREPPRPVMATFEAAIREAAERRPGSEDVLLISAFIAPDEIPVLLFQEPAEEGHTVEPDFELAAKLQCLEELGLISFTPDRRSFSVHRLVQTAAREVLGSRRDGWANRAAALMRRSFPANHELDTWPTIALLSRHASELGQFVSANADLQAVAAAIGEAAATMHGVIASQDEAAALEAAYEILTTQVTAAESETGVLWLFANACTRLAVALQNAGQLERASKLLREGHEVRQRLAAGAPDDPKLQDELAGSIDLVGDLVNVQGDLATAESSYRRALAVREHLGARVDDARWQRNRAHSLGKLGGVFVAQGDLSQASRFYEESLDILKHLSQQLPDNEALQRELLIMLDRMGDVFVSRGELGRAEDLFRRSLAIAERMVDIEPSDTVRLRDVSVARERLGDLFRQQGIMDAAFEIYSESLMVRERLARSDPENAALQRDFAVSLNKVGDVLFQQGRLVDALNRFRQAAVTTERLAQADPGNVIAQRDLAISHDRLADILTAQGNLAEAQRNYEMSLAIAERLAHSDSRNRSWMRDLAIARNKLGNLFSSRGELGRAKEAHVASLEIMERLAARDPGNAGWQRDLALSLGHVGNIEATQGNREAAIAVLSRGRAMIEELIETSPSRSTLARDLSWFDEQLARLN